MLTLQQLQLFEEAQLLKAAGASLEALIADYEMAADGSLIRHPYEPFTPAWLAAHDRH